MSSCRTWPGKYPSTRSACPGRRWPTGYSRTSPAPTSWPCITNPASCWLSQGIFALAAAAVVVVALQVTIWPGQEWVVGLEVLCLIGLLFILRMNRRLRLHDQWISSRFLAERLRSSYFLALAGTGDRRGRSPRIAFFSDSSEAWIERALSEVIACRPHLDAESAPLEVLRDYLKRHWIEGQISYQTRSSGHQRVSDRWLVLDDQNPLLGDPDRRACAQQRELHRSPCRRAGKMLSW